MNRFFCVILSWTCATFLYAQTLQDQYGICTHITRPRWDYEIRDRELALTREAGIGWVRSDLDAGNFFTKKAEDIISDNDCKPEIFNNVLNSLEAHRQNLLAVLWWMGPPFAFSTTIFILILVYNNCN